MRGMYRLLRRLAEDQCPRLRCFSGKALSVQCRAPMQHLRTPAGGTVPAIHLRLARRQQPASRMDAAGPGAFDFASGKFSVAVHSGPCGGPGRRTAERQGDPEAEGVLSEEPSPADFSNRRRMYRLRSTASSNRHGGAAVARRAAVVLNDDASVKMRRHRASEASGARTALTAAR